MPSLRKPDRGTEAIAWCLELYQAIWPLLNLRGDGVAIRVVQEPKATIIQGIIPSIPHPFRVEAGTEDATFRVRRGWILIDNVWAGWSPHVSDADPLSEPIAAAAGWLVMSGAKASPGSWTFAIQSTAPADIDAAYWRIPIAHLSAAGDGFVVDEPMQTSGLVIGAYL